MSKQKTVLVATDLSEEANEAICQAHAWATADNARLIACTALPASPLRPIFPHVALDESRSADRAGVELADALRDRISRLTGRAEGDVSIRVERGAPYAEILRAAEREAADLVVVGSRGESGIRRLLLGSTAEKVVRYAHCSVLVARPSPSTRSVLAATDLSDPSLPALRAGADFARRKKGELAALHCFQVEVFLPVASASFALPVPIAEERVRLRDSAEVALERALEKVGVEARPIVEEGHATKCIVDLAERLSTELVVVGTVGRTGLARLALGSVAEGVVRAAPCSTLVVRLHRGAEVPS